MIRPTRRKTQGQHLKAWVVETILARTEPTKAQSVKVLKAGLQDISVPGHFGADLDISVLGTGQFGTFMRQYSVLTTFVWYLLIVNMFVLVVL